MDHLQVRHASSFDSRLNASPNFELCGCLLEVTAICQVQAWPQVIWKDVLVA